LIFAVATLISVANRAKSQNRNNAMTDKRRPDTAAADAADRPPADRQETGQQQQSDPRQAGDGDPVSALARENAELKDKLLRSLAEMENLRRRTTREVADARSYGIASFARDILAVADNMARALQALDAELREKADAGVKALLDGVELTERELLNVLEKHGVRKFEPQGEKFDPNLHQAMYEALDPTLPAGTVAQVVQAGYMIGDRMLRPALVAVAKGGPKAAGPEPSANDNLDVASQEPDT
jgi:molecular chaperone GrpE